MQKDRKTKTTSASGGFWDTSVVIERAYPGIVARRAAKARKTDNVICNAAIVDPFALYTRAPEGLEQPQERDERLLRDWKRHQGLVAAPADICAIIRRRLLLRGTA